MKIIHSEEVFYAPKPNRATWRATSQATLDEFNVTSCFGLITYKDSLILITHIKRGVEIPGGHREPGESVRECLMREIKEECAVGRLEDVTLVAVQEIEVLAPKPENYNYPYPKSYQLVFKARAASLNSFTANLDSLSRVLVPLAEIKNHLVYTKFPYLFDLL